MVVSFSRVCDARAPGSLMFELGQRHGGLALLDRVDPLHGPFRTSESVQQG
jgi:hypothetical protein